MEVFKPFQHFRSQMWGPAQNCLCSDEDIFLCVGLETNLLRDSNVVFNAFLDCINIINNNFGFIFTSSSSFKGFLQKRCSYFIGCRMAIYGYPCSVPGRNSCTCFSCPGRISIGFESNSYPGRIMIRFESNCPGRML